MTPWEGPALADAAQPALHADDAISPPMVMSRVCRQVSEPRSIRTAGDIKIAAREDYWSRHRGRGIRRYWEV